MRTFQHAVPAVLRRGGRRPGRRDRHRASTSPPARCCRRPPTARRSACSPELPRRAARLGQALEAPRRAARGRPDQRRRRASAASRGCARYGGKISSEWFFAKALQILDEAPEVYARRRPADRGGRLGRLAADRRRDAQRLHRRLQGDVVEARRLPGRRLLRRARPAASQHVVDEKMSRDDRAARRPGRRADRARPRRWTGLRPGTAVAVANVDAHVVGAGRDRHRARARMVVIMGTSTCHMVLGDRAARWSRACAASSRTAIVPGPVRLRGRPVGASATSSPGSSSTRVPPAYHDEAAARAASTSTRVLERGGRAAAAGRERAARARLVERQPLGARRRRPERPAGRHDAGDDGRRRSTAR